MSAREFVAMAYVPTTLSELDDERLLFRTSIDFNLFIRSTCGPLLYLMNENFKSIRDHYIQGKEK